MNRHDTQSAAPIEQPELVSRTLHLLAWFGIVYGLLQAGTFVLKMIHLRSLYARIIATRDSWAMQRYFADVIADGVSVVLIICCIGLLKGVSRARMGLIVWALTVIALELVQYVVTAQRNLGFPRPIWSAALNLKWMALQVSFPVIVLCIVVLRRTIGAGGGFAVLGPSPQTSADDANSLPLDASAPFLHRLARCVAWFAAIFGLLCAINPAINPESLLYQLTWPSTNPRLLIVKWLDPLASASYAMLLIGGVMMILVLRLGRTMVTGWSILLLALTLAGILLFDAMYVWWQARHADYGWQTIPESAISLGLNRLRQLAFPLFALYVLWMRRTDEATGA
jgi:hypothetical protein